MQILDLALLLGSQAAAYRLRLDRDHADAVRHDVVQLTRDPRTLVGDRLRRALLALALELRRPIRQLAHVTAAEVQYAPDAPHAPVQQTAEDDIVEIALVERDARQEEDDDQHRSYPRAGRVELAADREAADEHRKRRRPTGLVLERRKRCESDRGDHEDRQRPMPPPDSRQRHRSDHRGGGDRRRARPANPHVDLSGDHKCSPSSTSIELGRGSAGRNFTPRT